MTRTETLAELKRLRDTGGTIGPFLLRDAIAALEDAERLARIKNGESCIKVYAPPGTEETRANAGYTMGQHMQDEYIVADYVVAQHRLDSVPLTEAVLRASGLYSIGLQWTFTGSKLYGRITRDGLRFIINGNYIGTIKTAGDLQRLCDALHLQITVVVPESEVAND